MGYSHTNVITLSFKSHVQELLPQFIKLQLIAIAINTLNSLFSVFRKLKLNTLMFISCKGHKKYKVTEVRKTDTYFHSTQYLHIYTVYWQLMSLHFMLRRSCIWLQNVMQKMKEKMRKQRWRVLLFQMGCTAKIILRATFTFLDLKVGFPITVTIGKCCLHLTSIFSYG